MKRVAKKKQNETRDRSTGAAGGGIHSGGEAEPMAGSGATPLWLVVVLGVAFYWGQLYLDRTAAGFHQQVYEPFDSLEAVAAANPKDEIGEKLARGASVYTQACGACHQASGLGAPGQFPPLVGSEWVLASSPGRLIRIALHGLVGPITVKGEAWNAAMPGGIGDALSPKDLAAALSYIRNTWGNQAGMVTEAQVEAVKKEHDGHGQWTEQELLKVPDTM